MSSSEEVPELVDKRKHRDITKPVFDVDESDAALLETIGKPDKKPHKLEE